ncbi:MAG: hypothetical protein RLY78_737 [Pseudomonadota bacterium]
MAGNADQVFLRAFRWFDAALTHLQAQLPAAPALPGVPSMEALALALRARLGLGLELTEATVDPAALRASNPVAQSLAMATLITGETLAALRTLGEVLGHLQAGQAELGDLVKVVRQIDRLLHADSGQPPSAYALAKLLLILSGDADAPSTARPAARLVRIVCGQAPDAALADATVVERQALLGLALIIVGTVIDRGHGRATAAAGLRAAPGAALRRAAARGPRASRAPIPLPASQLSREFTLARADDGSRSLTLQLGYDGAAVPPRVHARLRGDLRDERALGDGEFRIGLGARSEVTVTLALPALDPLPASLPQPVFDGALQLGLRFGRRSTAQPLVLGPADGTRFEIGELSGAIVLDDLQPALDFDLRDSRLVLRLGDDPLLGAVLGDEITVGLSFGLRADTAGGLRIKDGTGLRATVPLEPIPGSPLQIPFLTVELRTLDGLDRMEVELSGSFALKLGPFQGSVERLGTLLKLEHLLAGDPDVRWALKPPSGAGLAIDAGVLKGGGFLLFDPDRGEYGGVLDLKLMQIGIKAIALLNTHHPQGWSLLLIIAANLPPIQLGFGFTLTGLGGLVGVQHTVDRDVLSQGLASGALDSFLFPQDPVANAPQLFNQLRVIFPFKAGGFVIGPMLELGWGTPSLVTARVGLLIEPTQVVFVGQVIVQLPPLVDSGLAILRLQVDFAGGVVFSPLQIWFDGVLRDSRVLFIGLHGQFAFRARFGDQPTFLISAGGFHPRYTDLPPGLPSPFQRVGCAFSIGIVGVSFDGYFAVTSATVQAGAELHVWGDVGIASFDGGLGFNALVEMVPTFRFEVDIHVWAGVEVFGLDFASVDIYGLLAGPGRWHLVGRARIHTPWPLPDFSFHVDEAWGDEPATPVRTVRLIDALRPELENPANWSAQLAASGLAGATFAKPPAGEAAGLIAHPDAVLQFTQKRLPLGKALDKIGSDAIAGPRQIAIERVLFGDAARLPDRVLDDSFAAAQFLHQTADERLSRPSFDRFASGVECGQRQYGFGAAVGGDFLYEEVNLSTPREDGSLLALAGLRSRAQLDRVLDAGAAGRSPLRRPRGLRPEDATPLRVQPPPLAALDPGRGTLVAGALGGRAGPSWFHALDAADGRLVVEQFETAF